MMKDTPVILVIVFDLLYTLRNQILHDDTTLNSSANRSHLTDACKILSTVIPIILQVMMNNPKAIWGKGFYPDISVK
ncbi:hypothetical protein [Pasteurella sp. PK-2025]|uniref:hypothetical protein n=1 Tax=Pasteurella sp. PK-2025 TaxID=3413133 RepID=UPI003C707723